MSALLAISSSSTMFLLLGGAALILYIAGRFSIGAMPLMLDRSGPRAVIAAVPVMAISLIAVYMSREAVGLHLPIACATAAMTFGIAAIMTGREAPLDSTGNRAWALLIPAVAMLLIATLGGRLDLTVLIALVLYSLLALQAWREDPTEVSLESGPPVATALSIRMAALLWFVGIAAACVAGVLAVHGTEHLDAIRTRPSDGLVAVFLLAPAIVVPFFFEMLPPCRSIGWAGSMSSLLKFSLICLGCILPITALAAALMPRINSTLQNVQANFASSQPATLPTGIVEVPVALVFPSVPSIASRADLLVLVGVSLLLVPIGSGWLRPGKLEALALLMCYVLYLLLVMASSL